MIQIVLESTGKKIKLTDQEWRDLRELTGARDWPQAVPVEAPPKVTPAFDKVK